MRVPRRGSILTALDFRALEAWASTHGSRTEMILLGLLGRAGLRRAEACALLRQDVHADGEHPYLIVRRGKGAKYREVAIGRDLADLLADAEDPLLRGQRGALTPSAVWRIVRRMARQAGVTRPVHPHSFRHFYATQLLACSDLRLVQVQLGHASIKTTSVYLDVLPERAAEACARLDSAIGGGQ